jgi:hypothetical protein
MPVAAIVWRAHSEKIKCGAGEDAADRSIGIALLYSGPHRWSMSRRGSQ